MKILKHLLRIAALTILLFAVYALILCIPSPFFGHSVRAHSLVLHSDRRFSELDARHILELAETKLASSPLYSNQQDHHIYICNSRWRQMLFFNKDYGVGGVAPYPVSPHIFLRNASISDNRLISPHGKPVPGDRTLDYFIAHEITHQLTGRAIGPARYARLPQWVREGYADYVGKGTPFNYVEARNAFLAGAPEMDWKKSGLYWRYQLLVAYLLDHQHWSVMRLLQEPPAQDSVEAAIRNEQP
jgi:hypothetical protein